MATSLPCWYNIHLVLVALDTLFLPKARRLVRKLESQHSKVYQEFVAENYSISRSDQHFLGFQLTQPWSNLRDWLEVKGWECWHIPKSKIARKMVSNYSPKSLIALKKCLVLTESDHVTTKGSCSRRVKRFEEDVIKLVYCFSSGLMGNPFVQEMESLINFATGVVLTWNVTEGPVSSNEKGRERTKILYTNTVNPWDPVPSLNVQTLSTMSEKSVW